MHHSLLALLLVATQLLAFPAAPLYLCVSAEGTLGIDFGPDHCDACPTEHRGDACCAGYGDGCCAGDGDGCQHELQCGHANCSEHVSEHACNTLGLPDVDDADPCGCTHIQISAPQTATLERLVLVFGSDHGSLPALAVLAGAFVPLPELSLPPAALRVASVASLSAAVTSSAVMRC